MFKKQGKKGEKSLQVICLQLKHWLKGVNKYKISRNKKMWFFFFAIKNGYIYVYILIDFFLEMFFSIKSKLPKKKKKRKKKKGKKKQSPYPRRKKTLKIGTGFICLYISVLKLVTASQTKPRIKLFFLTKKNSQLSFFICKNQ